MKTGLIAAVTLPLTSLAVMGCAQEDVEVAASESCDRDCILEATDTYLSALAANDPGAAPLAEDFVLVENLQRTEPGQGLWASATGGATDFAIAVPDPVQQQAGWMGVVERDGEPVMLALRLKLEGGQIVEAEHLVAEPVNGNMEHLQQVRPGLLATIPEGERLPQDELIRIGATYYDALENDDGSLMPFAPDCQRRENGLTTAGEGTMGPPNMENAWPPTARDCAEQLDSNAFNYIARIDNRRMIAADPATGLAMGLSHLRHPFDNLPYEVTNADGSTSERNAENMPFEPFDMPSAHIFKIGPEGTVHEIEAVGVRVPYDSPSGWE